MNSPALPSTLNRHYRGLAWLAALLLAALTAGCGGGGNTSAAACPAAQIQALEAAMNTQLALAVSEVDFSFAVERQDGRRYAFDRGASTLQTVYESASTSKLVSAVIIMRLVEQGYLTLSAKPQDLIQSWPIASSDPLYGMTLANLMSFTSGLTVEPPCLSDPNSDLESCVSSIANTNAGNGITAGSQFFYAATHQDVAGLMAVKARGVASWQDVFAEFKAQTGLFPTSTFDIPSLANPRIAGGMHFTGEEYLAFLRALKAGSLLNASSMSQMLADHTASVPIVYSPIFSGIGGGPGLGEDWHFGFGLFHECQSATFNCVVGARISSPGALGSYPFWDRSKNYTGIVVRQGVFGTLPAGILIERTVQPIVDQWAACS
jgi:CubicO group peptidase (beta-lactamase class C family)